MSTTTTPLPSVREMMPVITQLTDAHADLAGGDYAGARDQVAQVTETINAIRDRYDLHDRSPLAQELQLAINSLVLDFGNVSALDTPAQHRAASQALSRALIGASTLVTLVEPGGFDPARTIRPTGR